MATAPAADIVPAPVQIPTTSERWFEVAATPRFALPLLTILSCAAVFVNLGGYPLYTKGEPREAVAVLDMFRGHSLSSYPVADAGGSRNPLQAAADALADRGALVGHRRGRRVDGALPSAILAVAGVLCCYLYVRRLFNERAALFSALMLATSLQYLQAAGGARVDMTSPSSWRSDSLSS